MANTTLSELAETHAKLLKNIVDHLARLKTSLDITDGGSDLHEKYFEDAKLAILSYSNGSKEELPEFIQGYITGKFGAAGVMLVGKANKANSIGKTIIEIVDNMI